MVRHRAIERSDVVRRANPLLAGRGASSSATARSAIGARSAAASPTPTRRPNYPRCCLPSTARSKPAARGELARSPRPRCLKASSRPRSSPTSCSPRYGCPRGPPGTGWSIQEFSRRSGDFAIVGVAATVRLDGNGNVAEARLAFSGVDQVPVRATAAESLLAGATPSDDLWKSAAHAAAAPLEPG